MEYLDFWMTRSGIRPINKKVESILDMMPPKTKLQVSVFIGLVKYYRVVWSRRTHLIQPLTKLTPNKVTFKWADVEKYILMASNV